MTSSSSYGQVALNLSKQVCGVRAALTEGRTARVNAARGLAKVFGQRLPACDADQMRMEQLAALPESLRLVLQPLIEEVESLTGRIKVMKGLTRSPGNITRKPHS